MDSPLLYCHNRVVEELKQDGADPSTGPTAPGKAPSEPEEALDPNRPSVVLVASEHLAPVFFAVLFLGSIAALAYVLRGFVTDMVLAFILVGTFRSSYERLVPKIGGNKWVASALVTLLALVLIIAPVVGIVYTLALEIKDVYGVASTSLGSKLIDNMVTWAETAGLPASKAMVMSYAKQLATSVQDVIVSAGSSVFTNILSISVHLATVLVVLFYLLVDGDRLKQFMYDLSPLPDEEDALIVETFKRVSKGVLVGNGLGSLIQGVLGGAAFWLAELPSPVLWGTVMTVFAFLPLVGITIVVVPATVVLYMQGQATEAFVFASFCTVQGLVVENVIKTKMMGSAMRVHDLLIFMSVLGGIASFGLIGLLYGPLIAMLFLTLHDLYERVYRPLLAEHWRVSRG